ncbi:hypothetical protein HO173_013265 [Letharia columbiana]|uniref:Uncharacterized protein n=1 Tax=Letharia columbiana TaxID=112416 RepID=A0A8H6CGY0_9LECA|nr:uncharacterized protein HO173_013265 [Letharia columbiana]KAF6223165.1 hypothetical protein HO173_013265 [Letharia columbiana]
MVQLEEVEDAELDQAQPGPVGDDYDSDDFVDTDSELSDDEIISSGPPRRINHRPPPRPARHPAPPLPTRPLLHAQLHALGDEDGRLVGRQGPLGVDDGRGDAERAVRGVHGGGAADYGAGAGDEGAGGGEGGVGAGGWGRGRARGEWVVGRGVGCVPRVLCVRGLGATREGGSVGAIHRASCGLASESFMTSTDVSNQSGFQTDGCLSDTA